MPTKIRWRANGRVRWPGTDPAAVTLLSGSATCFSPPTMRPFFLLLLFTATYLARGMHAQVP